MVKPTLLQKVLRRPSQRYTTGTASPNLTALPSADTERPRAWDYHSTKEELLRIAADLNREDSSENTHDTPSYQTNHPHRGTNGEFLQNDVQVTTSAAAALPASASCLSATVSTGAAINIRGDVASTEHRNLALQTQDGARDDISEVFYTPATSPASSTSPASCSPPLSRPQTPLHSPPQTPSTTPSNSAASSTTSLTDFARSSTSLSEHRDVTQSAVAMIPILPDTRRKHVPNHRKITYTDQDWAKDVRWLVAPQANGTGAKHKGKVAKKRCAPLAVNEAASRSASSLASTANSFKSKASSAALSGRPPLAHAYTVSSTHLPPSRPGKSKGKAKISTARTVIGMTALLEVEEDLEPEFGSSNAISSADRLTAHKRSQSLSYPSDHPPERSPSSHKPLVSSPLRTPRLTRQRSSSSPSLLLPQADGATPKRSSSLRSQTQAASSTGVTTSVSPRRAFSTASRPLSTTSRVTSSTSKSPYTSAAPNALDALAAHVSVSEVPDSLPSSGLRGFTSLVLPRATTTSPTVGAGHDTTRPGKLSRGRTNGATVRDSIGVGLGLGDQVDLTRAGLAQTTMASVEVVRGIAAGSGTGRKMNKSRGTLFGMSWFSKDRAKSLGKAEGKKPQEDTETPLGFTAYRTPPVYVGGGSVLVQVWGVGLDGTDARLAGISLSRTVSSSFQGAPYGAKGSKNGDKEKGRHAPVGYIPGRSFVGRVLEVGWEVGEEVVKRGDWVVGLMSVHKCGALAEFILADRHRVHRIPHPVIPSKYPRSLGSPSTADEVDGDELNRRNSLVFPAASEGLTVNDLALLPLCGVPAYRAVRTFHQITQVMGKPQLPDHSHGGDPHPILPPRSDGSDFAAGEGQEGFTARPWDSRPRALVLRGHDGAGALAAQMLVREGWSVWAHVPVPFMLPGPTPEVSDDLKDEEEEKELENRRSILWRIEERLRGWGVDEVLFVPVASMPLSALFGTSNTEMEAMTSWSSPSIHIPRSSSSSSPSISPSPFSRSTTSSPLSSPYSHVFSSGHFSSASPPSSSTHQHAFTTPYSFSALPLAPYECEHGSVISLMSYLSRSRVRLDAILDSIGGREIWEAGRSLLSRPVRDPSRQDVDAQFTTLVGDAPDRVVSTAGDNFRAGVRSLRIGSAKEQHAFEDSGYHEAVTHGGGKEKKSKLKPRPVNYSWVNIVSDIDWEGSDVRDSLSAVLKMAVEKGVRSHIGPADFPNTKRKDKGKRRAVFNGGDGVEEELQGKVVPFESTPHAFVPGGGLEHGGTIVSRIAG